MDASMDLGCVGGGKISARAVAAVVVCCHLRGRLCIRRCRASPCKHLEHVHGADAAGRLASLIMTVVEVERRLFGQACLQVAWL